LVSDATATPALARDLIARIRTVSDKPIKYVLLTHDHAVRVLGASAFKAEGATEIIASHGTLEMIKERGAQDMKSEMERFPRLFQGAEEVTGLTWPTLVVGDGKPGRQGSIRLDLGGVWVEIWHPGSGHTKGDTIAWVEFEKVLFSGDLVEYEAGVYTGDAQLAEWPATLDALRDLKAEAIVPGRGEAMKGNARVNQSLDYTRNWVQILCRCAQEAVAQKMDLKAAMAHTRKQMDPVFGHVFIYELCLPFDVSRAFDEASGLQHPRIWTAERDMEMWASLQA
jgi:glyoxylase-like metal-dependent hydrolase (beta-lactamase superfamily II)